MIFTIFVVYIHSTQSEIRLSGSIESVNNPLWFSYLTFSISTILSRCAVPGFFLISSILLYRKEFGWFNNIKKKFKTILIPYIIINSVWIGIFALFQTLPFTSFLFNDPNNVVMNFSYFRWFQAYGIGSLYPFLGPLWFLRNLFIFNLLSTIIKKIIDTAPKTVAILLVLMWLFVPNGLFYYINPSDLCMWCLGYYIVKYNYNLDLLDNKKSIVTIVYIIIFVLCILNKYSENALINLLLERTSIFISIVFWYNVFSCNISNRANQFLLKYATYSFGIYIFHEMAIVFVKKIIAKLFGSAFIVQLLQYLFMPVGIIILCMIICYVFRILLPKTFSIITGERVKV